MYVSAFLCMTVCIVGTFLLFHYLNTTRYLYLSSPIPLILSSLCSTIVTFHFYECKFLPPCANSILVIRDAFVITMQ